LANSLLQGLIAFAVVVVIYVWALSNGWDENTVRALVFVADGDGAISRWCSATLVEYAMARCMVATESCAVVDRALGAVQA